VSFAGHVFTVGFEGLEGSLTDFVEFEDDDSKAERFVDLGFFADADHAAEGGDGLFAGEVGEGEGVVAGEDEGVAFVRNGVGADEIPVNEVAETIFHFSG